MSFRGFTWNLTSTEVANVKRILAAHQRCNECHRWDAEISDHLLRKIEMFEEVTPDGPSPSHVRADA